MTAMEPNAAVLRMVRRVGHESVTKRDWVIVSSVVAAVIIIVVIAGVRENILSSQEAG